MTVTKAGVVSSGRVGREIAQAIHASGLPVTAVLVDGDFAELTGCDLVIECVPGGPDTKGDVLRRIESHISPGAVLATDASAEGLAYLAKAVDRPAQLLAMHFTTSTSVEIAGTSETAPGALMSASAFCRWVGWTSEHAAADAAE